MHTKTPAITLLFLSLCLSTAAHAQEVATHPADHQHGSEVWHMFTLEMDYGGGAHGPVASWDLNGWIGTDENKIWLKSEGENEDGTAEQAEFWAMYSRNVSDLWDFQAGVRYDTQPATTSYLVLGLEGLAPYFFETEAHLFISDEGDVSARLRQENEFLITQKLILEPYAEINLFAQDVEDQDVGAGLSSGEIGLQTRYEITRKFAPYIDVKYERAFGETSSIAKREDGDNDNFITAVSVRFMF